MDDYESGTDEIRQYLALLRRWLWLIVLATALGAGAAFVASRLSTPIYEASTVLLISEGQQPTGQDYSAVLMSERLAKTYAEMLQGRPVLHAVEQQLGLPLDAATVSVTPIRDTQLLRLTVRHPDPMLAAGVANALPQAFVEQNDQAQAARFASSLESLNGEMQRIQGEIDATQHDLDAARADPAQADDGKVARLEGLLAQYRATYAGLLQSYEEVRIAQARATDSVTVYEPALVPRSPALPRTRTNVILAAVVGAMLAVGAAFLIEYLDDTVKQPEDLERAVGLPTFASILRVAAPANGEGPVMAVQPESPAAEAYRMLRTNLEFSTLGMGPTAITLLVTSAEPQDGKTTTLANLGVSLAQAGKRVLLVDTDLRRPTLHQQFGLPNEHGLTSLLLDPQADPAAVIHATGVQGLRVLTTGPLPSNPAEVLDYPQAVNVLGRLRAEADYILLDSPPVLSVADASVLAQKVDGVILIVEAGRTRTDLLRRAVRALRAVNAHLLGAVLNNVAPQPGSGYHYYYYRRDGSQRRDRPARDGRPASQEQARPAPQPHRKPSRPETRPARQPQHELSAQEARPAPQPQEAGPGPQPEENALSRLASGLATGLAALAAQKQAAADRPVYAARARLSERRARLDTQKSKAFWTLMLLASLALLLFAAAALYEAIDAGLLAPAQAAPGYGAGAVPTATADAGTAEPTFTPRPTFTAQPTATEAVALVAETASLPTLAPTQLPPTPRPTSTPTATPTPAAGTHGVAAHLRLRDPQPGYAVGEQVFLLLDVGNHTAEPIALGIVGLKAGDALPFHSSWSQVTVGAYGTLSGEDHLVFDAPGTYPLTAAICFSASDACQGPGADWEEFPTGLVLTIR